MTYDDVIVRTAGLLVLLAAVGVATFSLAPGLWPGPLRGSSGRAAG